MVPKYDLEMYHLKSFCICQKKRKCMIILAMYVNDIVKTRTIYFHEIRELKVYLRVKENKFEVQRTRDWR